MKCYTQSIPLDLAEKLKAAGMPMMPCFNIHQTGSFSDDDGIHFYYTPTYAEVFDWMIENRIYTYLDHDDTGWSMFLEKDKRFYRTEDFDTWHGAANKAIEKALDLIKGD